MSLVIIPARYASTRFPGKPLVDILGQPMIERVYRQALKANHVEKVVVATDHQAIYDCVIEFGGEVVMTSAEHTSGTDRCLEALEKINGEFKNIINLQGDEPFIDPSQIDQLAELLQKDEVQLATLIKPMQNPEDWSDPNKVKAVINHRGEALYFSRSRIPFGFDSEADEQNSGPVYKHVGIYGYKNSALKAVCKLAPSYLEKSERLEQLRWLENGWKIHTAVTNLEAMAVDSPADLERIITTYGG